MYLYVYAYIKHVFIYIWRRENITALLGGMRQEVCARIRSSLSVPHGPCGQVCSEGMRQDLRVTVLKHVKASTPRYAPEQGMHPGMRQGMRRAGLRII